MPPAAPEKTLGWEKTSVQLQLHACSQEVRGGVHLAAPGFGLGLELVFVYRDAARTPHPHAAATLDALQAAEELGGQVHAAACPLFPTALPGAEVSACVLKRKPNGQKVVVVVAGEKGCRRYYQKHCRD